MLGNIPVVPVSARKRTGLNILLHAVKHHYEEDVQALVVKYSDEIEKEITMVTEKLCETYPELSFKRWDGHPGSFWKQYEQMIKAYPVDLPTVLERSYEKEIINGKYKYIEEIMEEVLFYKHSSKEEMTDRVDQIPDTQDLGERSCISGGIMALVFFLDVYHRRSFRKEYLKQAWMHC